MSDFNVSRGAASCEEGKRVSAFRLSQEPLEDDEYIAQVMRRLASAVMDLYTKQCLYLVRKGCGSGELRCQSRISPADTANTPSEDAKFTPSLCINQFSEYLSLLAIKAVHVQDLPLFMAMLLPEGRGGKGLKSAIETYTSLRVFGYSDEVLSSHAVLQWVVPASGLRVCAKTASTQSVLDADVRVASTIRQHFKPGGDISHVCALRVNDAFRAAVSKVEFKEMQEWMLSSADGDKRTGAARGEEGLHFLSCCPLYIHQKLLDDSWSALPPSSTGFYCPPFDAKMRSCVPSRRTQSSGTRGGGRSRSAPEKRRTRSCNRGGAHEKEKLGSTHIADNRGVQKHSDAGRKLPTEPRDGNEGSKSAESHICTDSKRASSEENLAKRWADHLQSLQIEPPRNETSENCGEPEMLYKCRECGDVTECWWLSSMFYTFAEQEGQRGKRPSSHNNNDRHGASKSSCTEPPLASSVERVAMTRGALCDLIEKMLLNHAHRVPAASTPQTRMALDNLVDGFGGGSALQILITDVLSPSTLRAHLFTVVQDVVVVLLAMYTYEYPELRNRALSVSTNLRETSDQLSRRMCRRLGESGGVLQAMKLLEAEYQK